MKRCSVATGGGEEKLAKRASSRESRLNVIDVQLGAVSHGVAQQGTEPHPHRLE
jgi:hypothetical protein